MALTRNKVIIALIPFVATTIGIIIFLIFFNYGDIVFTGNAPFTVAYRNQEYTGTGGTITIHTDAGSEQRFLVKKPQYDDQEITRVIPAQGKEIVNLNFTFTPVAETISFIMPFIYPGRSDIADNQSRNLIFSTAAPSEIEIPKDFTKVVWAQDGQSACLFNPKLQNMAPRLWRQENQKITLNKLPENTFECFSTNQELLNVQLRENKLLINEQISPLELPENFYLIISPSGRYVLISAADKENSFKISILDRSTNEIKEITVTDMKEFPRFIGTDTFAIRSTNKITVYVPGKDPADIVKNIELRNLIYSEVTHSLYYPDTVKIAEQPQLQNLSKIFEEPQKAHSIIAYDLNTQKERIIFTFTDLEQNIFGSAVSSDQKKVVFLTGDQGSTKLQITISN